jgi:hypothetical protein
MRKHAKLVWVVALVAVLAATPALAGKGAGKGRPGSRSVAEPSIVLDQRDPRFGDSVTFTVTYAPMRENARIWVRCWQGETWVYQRSGGELASFTLWASGTWESGGASCIADLYYNVYQGQDLVGAVYLAQTWFDVAA